MNRGPKLASIYRTLDQKILLRTMYPTMLEPAKDLLMPCGTDHPRIKFAAHCSGTRRIFPPTFKVILVATLLIEIQGVVGATSLA